MRQPIPQQWTKCQKEIDALLRYYDPEYELRTYLTPGNYVGDIADRPEKYPLIGINPAIAETAYQYLPETTWPDLAGQHDRREESMGIAGGDGMTPDLEHAVKGRRKNLKKIWSGKEWKAAKEAFLKIYPNCEMHKSAIIRGKPLIVPATIPHHPYRNSYQGHYTDLELSQCVAYCARCHFALHKGLKLCQTCGEHYHRWDQEVCWACFCKNNPDVVKQIEDRKEIQRVEDKVWREMVVSE